MAIINLTSEQLDQLSRQLTSWKQEIAYTNRSIRNTVAMVDGWKDPQFAMFKGAIEMTYAQLEQYCNSLEGLAKSLKMYSDQQKEVNSSFGQNINSTHH